MMDPMKQHDDCIPNDSIEGTQVVNHHASNTPHNSYELQGISPYIGPLFYDSSNNFVYKGTTYYSYDALVHSHECFTLLKQVKFYIH